MPKLARDRALVIARRGQDIKRLTGAIHESISEVDRDSIPTRRRRVRPIQTETFSWYQSSLCLRRFRLLN